MRVGVPKETAPGERRVALVPEVVKRLSGLGLEVVVQAGAGDGAQIPDAAFTDAGAKLASDPNEVWQADVVVKVAPPTAEEIVRLRKDGVLIGYLNPLAAADTIRALAASGATSFAMEAIPRITRAQSMDALSSQATVAGYEGALMAARRMTRFFPMLTTAAGTIPPAKVLVLGAGVAGLQAIATAKRLGARVTAFDVRAAVKEQINSLGAQFLELEGQADAEAAGGYARELTEEEQQAQRAMLADAIAGSDAVISTAAVPGRPAPKLITAEAVARMAPGSVIVDLASETGGNCELTKPGEEVVEGGVLILGPLNVPSQMPEHASRLYAKNIDNLLALMVTEEGDLELDFEDEVIAGACITRGGEIVHEGAKGAAG
jgi:H+-translocating NAD(P) transhydrogenase subunit alpha